MNDGVLCTGFLLVGMNDSTVERFCSQMNDGVLCTGFLLVGVNDGTV